MFKNTCRRVSLPILHDSKHTGCYISISLVHMIYLFICIIYLHVIETCLKLWLLCFIFAIRKTLSNIFKNVINCISIFLKKIIFLNKHKKQMCCKKTNLQIFPSKGFHFQYDNRLCFS